MRSSALALIAQVVRTRLREAPSTTTQRAKYHGLVQTFRLVAKEEGMLALYAGLSPHLLRTVPNAIVLYAVAEGVLRLYTSKS